MDSQKVRIGIYQSFRRKPESRFNSLVSCFRRDDTWTPAFAGVTALTAFYDSIRNKNG